VWLNVRWFAPANFYLNAILAPDIIRLSTMIDIVLAEACLVVLKEGNSL
jgi:hypothetical protein